MMNFRSAVRVFIAFLVVMSCFSVSSYQVKELSLEEKVRGSELVVIGKVVSVERHVSLKSYSTAVVSVTSTLKGRDLKFINFGFDGMIEELNPDCCVKGEIYLFFLEKSEQDEYFSFNPPYGVYPMGGADAVKSE